MLTKLLKKSEGPTRVVPTQIKRAVKQVETRVEKRKSSGFKLPSFARAKKPAAHSALVEQYVLPCMRPAQTRICHPPIAWPIFSYVPRLIWVLSLA